ncbi:MAG TPA: hypothetical protein VFM44_05210 [Gemmatimonadota bacterium]|nr:hypothetical protein [Gemmatimonadota bacterium]
MRIPLAIALLCATIVGCADAQTPDAAADTDAAAAADAAAADTIVIADGRVFAEAEDVSDWAGRAAVQAAFAAARAHWQAQDPDYEEEAGVMAVAEGSFSEPGVSQYAVLYLMSSWPRCCPKTGIAVVQDGELVRNVAFESPTHGLVAIPDLDGDGLDELALTGSFGMGGENTTSVTLVSLADSGLRTWGGEMIQYDACGAMQEGGQAVRITAVPGPAFTIERFSLASCESGEYQPGGPPEPFEFPAPGEETSVELPLR